MYLKLIGRLIKYVNFILINIKINKFLLLSIIQIYILCIEIYK